MTQTILAFLLLGIAIYFLANKFFGGKKSDKNCDKNCGC